MRYMTISFTHKNTSIEVREQLSFGNDEALIEILEKIKSFKTVNEVIVLSTCNRVEIITSTKECKDSLKHILNELAITSSLDRDDLERRADVYEDSGAVHHLFSVAASLDSLVIGETQIAGQLKDAFRFAFEQGYCSQKLARVMHKAFACAAKVREQTDISKSPISVSSVAVSKAKEMLGNLGGMSAVVVGAGEMASLAAKNLVSSGVNTIILSRNFEKAKNLADSLGVLAKAENLIKLQEYINRYRIIFSATSASSSVITDKLLEEKDFDRYFFDIAVPRDIDVTPNEKIHVYAVDDLHEIVHRNMALREEQAQRAYGIVRQATIEFFKWLQTLALEPLIKEMRLIANDCATAEIEKAIKKGYVKSSDEEEIRKLVHQVFKSFLHKPTKNLRDISELPEADTIAQAIQYIFDINEDHSKNINHYKCEYEMETKI